LRDGTGRPVSAVIDQSEKPSASLVEIVRRRWWLPIVCAVLGALSAGLITQREQKQYEATAKLLFRVDTSPDLSVQSAIGLTPAAAQIDPSAESATNVALVSVGPVADLTAQALGHNETASGVASEISVAEIGQSNVITITATDPSPAFAATLANTFARQFIVFRTNLDRSLINVAIQSVENQLNALVPAVRAGSGGHNLQDALVRLQALAQLQSGNAQLVQSASDPSSPSSPRTKINVAVGVLLGLVVGIMLAFFLYRSDGRAETPEDLAEQYHLPVLGVVPRTRELLTRGRRAGGNGTVSAGNGAVLPASTAEAFRALRARLRYFNADQTLNSVLVTSATSGEGKSTVAWQLARVLALAGNGRVLALETDLRRPAWARVHGLRATPGLVDVLTDAVQIEAAVQTVDPRAGEPVVNGNGRPGTVPRESGGGGAIERMILDRSTLTGGPRLDLRRKGNEGRGIPAGFRFEGVKAAPAPGSQFIPSLDVLVAGTTASNPSDLFESGAMLELLDTLEERYDFVVLDAPPGPVVSDIFPLMSHVSGVVIVGSLRHASKRAAAELRDQLELANARVLGLVANNAKRSRNAYYGHHRRRTSSINGTAKPSPHAQH